MEAGQYIRELAEFISGEIELASFKQWIENRLFDLRQDATVTEEKQLLSEVELFLHEAEEGLRCERDVYAQVQSTLDEIILKRLPSNPVYFSPTPTKLSYSLSKAFEPPKKPRTINKELALTASK